MKHLLTSVAIVLCTAFGPAAMAQPAPSKASAYPVEPAPGLYQAFGEEAGIRTLMDDFVGRLKADPRIGQQFRETHPDILAKALTSQLCQLSGGPCVYKSADMKNAHADRKITRADFNALVEVLQQSMEAQRIPFSRQNQMLALLAPMYRDTVTVH